MGDPATGRRPLAGPSGDEPSRDLTDALLVAAGRGDLDAFAAFYDLTAPFVFGMLHRVLRHPARAERVTRAVYRHLWRTAPGFDPAIGRSAYATVLLAARRALVGPLHDLVTAGSARPPGQR